MIGEHAACQNRRVVVHGADADHRQGGQRNEGLNVLDCLLSLHGGGNLGGGYQQRRRDQIEAGVEDARAGVRQIGADPAGERHTGKGAVGGHGEIVEHPACRIAVADVD